LLEDQNEKLRQETEQAALKQQDEQKKQEAAETKNEELAKEFYLKSNVEIETLIS
jgi:hypothetical protein